MLWLILLGTALICLHVFLRLLNRKQRDRVAHLPTYSCLPFIGNMHWFIGDGKTAMHHLEEVSRITEETGKPFVVWIGQQCLLVLSDLEESKIVANAFVEKPYLYRFVDMWVKDGVVTAPGYIWKRNIKKIVSIFNSSTVDGFQPIFNKQAEKLVRLLKKESNGEPFDLMHKYLALIALEAIFQTALSNSDSIKSTVTNDYFETTQRLLELIFKRCLNIFLHPVMIYRLTPSYRQMKQYVDVIHNVSETILNRRRKEIQEEKAANAQKTTDTESSDGPIKSFLDILLEMSTTDKTLTDDQIQAEVNTIIFAGQETVTTALNFIFLMLGCKPDVQQKVYEEIKEVFGNSKRDVLKEDLPRLRYCEAVICETMRLLPPVPGVFRYADRDLELGRRVTYHLTHDLLVLSPNLLTKIVSQTRSCMVSKGTTCMLNFLGTMRSRRLWKDPLSYQPERWLDSNFELPLLNFSIGRRACIGRRYAMSMMKTMLVHCIRELEFTSEAEKMTLRIDVTLRPASHHLLSVRLRDDIKQKTKYIA